MKQFNESILGLQKNSAAAASETKIEGLVEVASSALCALYRDDLAGAKEAWVYETILHGMVQSGALKVAGQSAISSRMSFQE
jgi:hypothetical protein